MELDEFDTKTKSNEGAEIELLSLKTRAKSGVFIKVLGIDSDLFQDLKAQRSRELMDAVQARGKDYNPTREEIDLASCEMLAKCTLGWRGLTEGGKEVEFSYAKAVDLYVKYPRIRDQINAAIADTANFVLG